MKLYYYPPSPNSRRAHAIALHLQLPIDFQLVDLQKGEQRTPDFLVLNPTGRIPVLQDGDFLLWESTAIMQYLASQVSTSIWPEDAKQRADIMRWQSWQLAHWAKGCQPLVYEHVVKQALQLGDPDPQAIQRATEIFHQEAAVLNAHLAKRDYLVNNTLTLADFSVARDFTYSIAAQFPLENYPHIRAWYGRIEALPAWRKTAPKG